MSEISIAEKAAQLQATIEQYLTVVDDSDPRLHESESSPAKILRDGGFPERHIQKLSDGLYGRGLDRARELWPKIQQLDTLVFLVGDRGPGKTQIATWWASELVRSVTSSVRYVKCADLIGEIKATWHDGGKRVGTEQDVMRKFRRAKYLVIDEFHERGSSDWESRCLINLIDHRYDAMLATVIIANLSEEKAMEEINPSLISRAQQTGGMVVCDWESYRVMEAA